DLGVDDLVLVVGVGIGDIEVAQAVVIAGAGGDADLLALLRHVGDVAVLAGDGQAAAAVDVGGDLIDAVGEVGPDGDVAGRHVEVEHVVAGTALVLVHGLTVIGAGDGQAADV